jgi:hypothetical protein
MSNRQPNFSIGDSVKWGDKVGKVKKVWTVNPSSFKYTVEFSDGKRVLEEGGLKRQ